MSGYSLKNLPDKLGIKPGFLVRIVNEPQDYSSLLGSIYPELKKVGKNDGNLDFIHLFTNSAAELNALIPALRNQLSKKGMLWISWYKKSAGKKTELTENDIRTVVLAMGLVDVKVCAVSDEWSGLKFVFRLKDR